jgi:hypothetical protein
MVDRKLLGERGSSGSLVFKEIGFGPTASLVCAWSGPVFCLLRYFPAW